MLMLALVSIPLCDHRDYVSCCNRLCSTHIAMTSASTENSVEYVRTLQSGLLCTNKLIL